MFCSQCGNQIASGSKFCSNCGFNCGAGDPQPDVGPSMGGMGMMGMPDMNRMMGGLGNFGAMMAQTMGQVGRELNDAFEGAGRDVRAEVHTSDGKKADIHGAEVAAEPKLPNPPAYTEPDLPEPPPVYEAPVPPPTYEAPPSAYEYDPVQPVEPVPQAPPIDPMNVMGAEPIQPFNAHAQWSK